jgi:hypothetical protein
MSSVFVGFVSRLLIKTLGMALYQEFQEFQEFKRFKFNMLESEYEEPIAQSL